MMAQPTRFIAFSAIALMLAACGGQEAEETEAMTFSRPEATANLIMELPVTTSSTDAADQFLQGQRAMDMGRFIDAYAHFTNAIEADQSFALAYLRAADAAPTLDAFKANLDSARQLAGNVTRAEQVLIEITQRGFLNDVEGQLQLANELVEVQSTSPRAWLTLAGIQT
ncbi:MAG: hypothetical protein JSW71_05580, partial [Gemmatimonadota bacterium]